MDNNYFGDLIKYESENQIDGNTKIKLTESADISGVFLIDEILIDEKDEKLKNDLNSIFNPIEAAYKEHVDLTKVELEKKIQGVEDGTIKSIEIIAIFSAILALLMSNVVGIVNASVNNLRSILIMNASIVSSIFFLLIFTRLLIREKDDRKSFWGSILVIVLFAVTTLILVA